jgi:hypothetical protein
LKDACPGITSPNQGVKLAQVDLGGLRALPQMMLPPDSARVEPTSPVLRKAGGLENKRSTDVESPPLPLRVWGVSRTSA